MRGRSGLSLVILISRCGRLRYMQVRDALHHRIYCSMRKCFLVAGLALFAGSFFMPAPAGAVVYCNYVGVPKGCVARAGVVYRPAPVVRAAPGLGVPGVQVNSPVNRGGPVNRVGRR